MSSIIESQADWRGIELARANDWIHHWSADELAEIDAALRTALARGRTLPTLTKEDFPLPKVGQVMAWALDALENRRGICHLRGIDVARYSKDELRLIYWGMGKHLGTAVSQSKDGDLLGDVRDFGVDINSPAGRGYKSNQRLTYHTDSCDVVGLMVLRTAREGGMSMIASSTAIHNEMARTRPDLLEILTQPFYWSWQGQEPAGDLPYYQQPLFTRHNGRVSFRYVRTHLRSAQRFEAVPRLTAAQEEALDHLDDLARSPAFHLEFMFQPGDIQLLNNHECLHSRTAFQDFAEEDRKRHLLRMWLSVPNSRELSPALATIFQDPHAGAVRGGFPSRTGRYLYETRHTLVD